MLVCALRSWRPRWRCATVLVLGLAWNISPLVWSYVQDDNDAAAKAATWTPAVAFLRGHLGPGYRVEAVDTATHYAAAYLAEAGIPLARGWYRQDDFPQNEVLYRDDVGRRAYVAWLHKLGVRYVVLADAPTDYSSAAEAKLVRDFRPVFHGGKVTVYTVPHPQPIAPGIVSLTDSRIQLAVRRPGVTRIGVRYSPYWHASHGCLSDGRDGMLRLRNLRARLVTITFVVSASRALGTLAGEKPDCDLRS